MSASLSNPVTMLRFSRRVKIAIGAAVLGLLAYAGSTALERPLGEQQIAFIPAKESCAELGRLKYCVNRAQAGHNDDVVYHLHGRNLDEHAWNDATYFTAMVQAEWQRTGVLPPTVVTVSYGSTWLLAPKGARAASGLLDAFLEDLSRIEATIGVPKRRILLGESMGGLNVLIAGLSHSNRFNKVAALCPGVYLDSPFAPFTTLKASAKRTGAKPKVGIAVVQLARKYFSDDVEWARASPTKLIEQADANYPALYLSCGLYDEYGNFEGSESLAKTAAGRGMAVDWQPIYGGHCATDIRSLASFLVK
jgi:pimeloyl-ACP methyl ester carboxylesterase